MTTVSTNTAQRADFLGVQPVDSNGNPRPIVSEPTLEALNPGDDATAAITNYDAATGKFDVNLLPGTLTGGATSKLVEFDLKVNPDLDGSGDAAIVERIAYTVPVPEASALNLGTPTISSI